MKDIDHFVPWWVRHQRFVVAGVILAVLGGAGSYFWVKWRSNVVIDQTDEVLERVDARKIESMIESGTFDKLSQPRAGEWRAWQKEERQHFRDWREGTRQEVTPGRRTLYLQPIGDFDAAASPDLETLAEFGRAYFGLPVVIREPLDPDELDIETRSHGRTGQQWLTTDVLRELEARLPDDAYAMLGLTMTDLWPRAGWNFVFGQAMLSKRVGIYSFARYDPGPDRATAHASDLDRERLVLLRSMKVMSHEMVHMFGVRHCLHYVCNMNGSNSLSETDAHPIHLCPIDLAKLQYAAGFDIEARYRKLGRFYEAHGFSEQAGFAWSRAYGD